MGGGEGPADSVAGKDPEPNAIQYVDADVLRRYRPQSQVHFEEEDHGTNVSCPNGTWVGSGGCGCFPVCRFRPSVASCAFILFSVRLLVFVRNQDSPSIGLSLYRGGIYFPGKLEG